MKVGASLAAVILAGCFGLPPPAEDSDPGAHLVPVLSLAPVQDRRLSGGEWDRALQINDSFVIDDGTPAQGTYPFRLWIGSNRTHLFLAAVVEEANPNPFSNATFGYPDVLDVFYVRGHSGSLAVPADWKVFYNSRENGSATGDGNWDGTEWVQQPDVSGLGRGGYGAGGIWWEIAIPRSTPYPREDVHLPPGAAFRLDLVFSRQGGGEPPAVSPDARGLMTAPHDAWPGEGYTPNLHYEPETWLKFRLQD